MESIYRDTYVKNGSIAHKDYDSELPANLDVTNFFGNLRDSNILVTGAAGFIGSNLALFFEKYGAKVVAFDIFRSEDRLSNGNYKSFGHFKNLLGFKGEIVSGDINSKDDIENLIKNYRFDAIFHQAAISDTTAKEQDLMMRTNVNSFKNILKIATNHRARVVYASSASVYGDCSPPQMLEKTNPQNIYGFSKFSLDNLASLYINDIKSKDNIKIVGLRYFNVYGKGEFYKGSTASMVISLAHQMLSGKSPKLFFDSDKIKRDFVYIDDIIQANLKAFFVDKCGVYNVGTGVSRSFVDIVKILREELGIDCEIEFFENPYKKRGYQFHTKADISKSTADLGYIPQFSLKKGIVAYKDEIKRLYNLEIKAV